MGQQGPGRVVDARGEAQPPYLYPDYVATRLRAPKEPLIILPKTLSDTTGPAYGRGPIGELDNDLTRQHRGEPLGERIIVTGRVTDGDGRPVRNSLIEIWQANAAGRYTHQNDRHPAPLDTDDPLPQGCVPRSHRRGHPLPRGHGGRGARVRLHRRLRRLLWGVS